MAFTDLMFVRTRILFQTLSVSVYTRRKRNIKIVLSVQIFISFPFSFFNIKRPNVLTPEHSYISWKTQLNFMSSYVYLFSLLFLFSFLKSLTHFQILFFISLMFLETRTLFLTHFSLLFFFFLKSELVWKCFFLT